MNNSGVKFSGGDVSSSCTFFENPPYREHITMGIRGVVSNKSREDLTMVTVALYYRGKLIATGSGVDSIKIGATEFSYFQIECKPLLTELDFSMAAPDAQERIAKLKQHIELEVDFFDLENKKWTLTRDRSYRQD